jgi:hypothetical protein
MKHCLSLNELSSKLVARLYDAETGAENASSKDLEELVHDTASPGLGLGPNRGPSDSTGIQELVAQETALVDWEKRLPSSLRVRFNTQISQFEWELETSQRQAVVLRTRYARTSPNHVRTLC